MGKSKRENNNRKHVGSGPRPDLSKVKAEEAQVRQVAYDTLTSEQKLEALNVKPNVNQVRCGGESKKQRAKLAALLEKKNAVVVAPTGVVVEVAVPDADEKKHLKAKDRRRQEQKKD